MNEDKTLFLSSFLIRLLALLTMTLDHIGIFLLLKNGEGTLAYEVASVFRVIGRIAFPLFAFLLAEGMRHTSNKNKYMLRLSIMMALIMVAQTIMVYGANNTLLANASNPFIDLVFVALVLYCLSLPKAKKLFALFPGAILVFAFTVGCIETSRDITITWWPFMYRPNESLLGLGAAIGFFYAPSVAAKFAHKFNQQAGISDELFLETSYGRRSANVVGCLFYFITVMALWGFSYINYRAFDPISMSIKSWGLLAIIPLIFYNGQKGISGLPAKIASYAYYPVHLIILYLIFGL
ncbi:MAG: conjugal transfer protein TraX [Bacilli bacterium]|nr:conjugal transfer protein TraX [Bacilli bacterium]